MVALGLAIGGEPIDNTLTGFWGGFTSYYMRKSLGSAGAWILFVLGVSALTVGTLRWNPIRMLLGPMRRRAKTDNVRGTASTLTMAERLAPSADEMPAIEPAFAAEALALANQKGKSPKGAMRANDVERFAPPGAEASSKRGTVPKEKGDAKANAINAGFDAMRDPDDDTISDELPPTDLLSAPPRRNVDAGIAELDAALEPWDVWIVPVAATSAFTHRPAWSAVDIDGRSYPHAVANGAYVIPFNLSGHPAVVIPIARTQAGLPMGLQIIGKRWREIELLSIAQIIDKIIGDFQYPQ